MFKLPVLGQLLDGICLTLKFLGLAGRPNGAAAQSAAKTQTETTRVLCSDGPPSACKQLEGTVREVPLLDDLKNAADANHDMIRRQS